MTTTGPKSNLAAGAAAALAGALVGGVVWAVITSVSDYKVGLVAVAAGALAGFLAGRVGGVHPALPVVAALAALVGCVVGDVLINAHQVAELTGSGGEGVSTGTVLKEMLQDPSGVGWPLYKAGFEGFDLLFYAIAAYAAFRLAQQEGARSAARAAGLPPTTDAPPAGAPADPSYGASQQEAPVDLTKRDDPPS